MILYNIHMKKISSKNDIYLLVFYLVTLILFILSVFLPIVYKNDQVLFLVHTFNPTTHEFSGKIENIYGPILLVATFLTFIPNFFELKLFETKQNMLYILSIKISCLLSIIFTIMNYLRVIYPLSFLASGDVSILQGGFYSLLFFIIAYILDIIYYIFKLKDLYRQSQEDKENRESLLRALIIIAFVGIFAFISTFCVPYFRNYTEYMAEEGFTHILDKRTSINFLLLAMFDDNFDFTLLSFLMIWANIYTPLTIIYKKDQTSLVKIIVANFISALLLLLAVLIGLENMSTITPIIKLEVDFVCCIFIAVLFLIYLLNIVFSILLIKKGGRNNA